MQNWIRQHRQVAESTVRHQLAQECPNVNVFLCGHPKKIINTWVMLLFVNYILAIKWDLKIEIIYKLFNIRTYFESKTNDLTKLRFSQYRCFVSFVWYCPKPIKLLLFSSLRLIILWYVFLDIFQLYIVLN